MSFTGWMDRRARVESTGDSVEGDRCWARYAVGEWRVLVPKVEGAEAPVLLVERCRRGAGPAARELPGLIDEDGRLTIQLEDLVQLVLDRSTPEEVARVLWVDDDVKEAFMDQLVGLYQRENTPERRRFLQRVQAEVYANALDRAVERISAVEWRVRDGEQAWRVVAEANRRIVGANSHIRQHNAELPEGGTPMHEIPPISSAQDPDVHPEYRIGGVLWHDGREAWRDRLQRVLAPPEVEEGSVDLRPAPADSPPDAPGQASDPTDEIPF